MPINRYNPKVISNKKSSPHFTFPSKYDDTNTYNQDVPGPGSYDCNKTISDMQKPHSPKNKNFGISKRPSIYSINDVPGVGEYTPRFL